MPGHSPTLVQRGEAPGGQDRQGVPMQVGGPQGVVQPPPGGPRYGHRHARAGGCTHRFGTAAHPDRQEAGSSRWTSGKRRLGTAWPLTTE